MANYAATNQASLHVGDTIGVTHDVAGIIGLGHDGSAVSRCEVYDLMWGVSPGTPADLALTYQVNRWTSITGTSFVPAALDPDSTPSDGLGYHSVTGSTITAATGLLNLGANQRSTQRWVAAPGGELVVARVINTGVLFSAIHGSSTLHVEAVLHFRE